MKGTDAFNQGLQLCLAQNKHPISIWKNECATFSLRKNPFYYGSCIFRKPWRLLSWEQQPLLLVNWRAHGQRREPTRGIASNSVLAVLMPTWCLLPISPSFFALVSCVNFKWYRIMCIIYSFVHYHLLTTFSVVNRQYEYKEIKSDL